MVSFPSTARNNIVPFVRWDDVMDAICEQWEAAARKEIEEEEYNNMEWEHNPFWESDLDSIPNDYWGYMEVNPFYPEELDFLV